MRATVAYVVHGLVAAALAVPALAWAESPRTIVARLNALRAAEGIPARIVEVPAWSADCALHDAWMAQNHVLSHEEAPGSPGTTTGGAWAGVNAVLAEGASWADGNPYQHAPLHLAQLLAPQLARAGADEHAGFGCVTTWPGYTRRTTANTIDTYPGDGAAYWWPSEVVNELPVDPDTVVGLQHGVPTGPHLYVFADGPWVSPAGAPVLRSATLTGPDGPVALRTLDRRTPTVGLALPPGSAVLVPVAPLRPHALYTATATLGDGTTTLSRTWSFRTAADNSIDLRVAAATADGVRFAVRTPARPTLTVSSAAGGGTRRVPVSRNGTEWVTAVVPVGSRFEACASSGGGTTGWVPARSCFEGRVTVHDG